MFQTDKITPEYLVTEIPHSREAEEAVVGAILINPDIYSEVGLEPDQFYIHRLAFIWRAAQRIHERGETIDILTVAEELDSVGRLDEVGGHAYLTSLLNQCPNSLLADEYAEIVRVKAISRQRLKIANQIAAKAYGGEMDIAPEVDALAKSTAVKRGAVELSCGLRELDQMVAERAKNPGDIWGIRTGLPDLDNMTGGLHPQQTTLIAGKPEVGKTTLMLQIALAAAQAGHSVAVYELEMDMLNVQMRLITLLGGPTVREMMRGRIPDEKAEKYYGALDTLSKIPLYICDNSVMTTMQVSADVARLQATCPIEMICLDYLDLLADADGENSLERSTLRSRRFRQVCRERKVHGLSVQSLNKTGIAADDPSIADVSGPAKVLYDADNIFLLTAEKDSPAAKLVPGKMRYAENRGIIPLVRKGMRFECVRRLP